MNDPEQLWRKLDALGEDAVRLKVAQGVYGERKLALVTEWLRRRDEASSLTKASEPKEPYQQKASTRYDRLVNRLKDNHLVVAALLVAAVLGGLAAFRQNVCALWPSLCGATKTEGGKETPSFAAHPAVGGDWYEQAFNARISFAADGSIGGKYYQYSIRGNWTPRSSNTLIFSAFFSEPDVGIKMQWDTGMYATITGNTMELVWPGTNKKDYLARTWSLPQRQ